MTETARAGRFDFGANWASFSELVDANRVREARESLASRLGDMSGLSFLDVGCGSGLFSLGAVQLGARPVRSFDHDQDSVQTSRRLKDRLQAEAQEWQIERGDILDHGYVDGLGKWDIVYSWGVLHHTGNMRLGWENICRMVAPGGRLFVSIYNDQGINSRLWRLVKRGYQHLPEWLQAAYVVAIMGPRELLISIASGPRPYVATWRNYKRRRGMSKWHDMVDWVGGYPFEVAKPEEVFHFFHSRGFRLDWMSTCGGRSGCNQFLFSRDAAHCARLGGLARH